MYNWDRILPGITIFRFSFIKRAEDLRNLFMYLYYIYTHRSIFSLNLSSSREAGQHEDVELLLGSYSADLDEILTEIKIFIDMIEV